MKLKLLFTLLLIVSFFALSGKKVFAAVGDRCTCTGSTACSIKSAGDCGGTDGITVSYDGYCQIYQDGVTCGPHCSATCTRQENCNFRIGPCDNPASCTYTPPVGTCDSTCTAGGIPNNPCGFRNSDGTCTTDNSCCRRVCQNCACKTVSGGGTNDCAVEGASCCSGCQTINAYIVPSPVQPGRAVTFTFTSNIGYTNVAFDPGGGATGCVLTNVSCQNNPMGDGLSCWWRWACTAVSTSGNYTGTFSNSESCPKTIPYSIQAILTPTPTRINTPTPTPTLMPCNGGTLGTTCGDMITCGDPSGSKFHTECVAGTLKCASGWKCMASTIAGTRAEWMCRNSSCPDRENCVCPLTPTPTPTTILARCIRIIPNRPLDSLRLGDEVNFAIGYTDLGLIEDVAFRIFKDGQILETRFQSTYPSVPDFMRFRITSPGRYSFAAYIKSGGVWR